MLDDTLIYSIVGALETPISCRVLGRLGGMPYRRFPPRPRPSWRVRPTSTSAWASSPDHDGRASP